MHASHAALGRPRCSPRPGRRAAPGCRCPRTRLPLSHLYIAAQLQEAEQQYAEIYEEYEKGRVFFANIEAEMHKAQQVRGGGSWRRLRQLAGVLAAAPAQRCGATCCSCQRVHRAAVAWRLFSFHADPQDSQQVCLWPRRLPPALSTLSLSRPLHGRVPHTPFPHRST